jgi:hypothetical protein
VLTFRLRGRSLANTRKVPAIMNTKPTLVAVPAPRTAPEPEPRRLGTLDIIRLTPVEVYAALVHLAGHQDRAVAVAVRDTVADVLARTRGD